MPIDRHACQVFKATGDYLDVRLAIVRTDFDPRVHGGSLSFWHADEAMFQSAEGSVGEYQASVVLFGFDEPHDGISIAVSGPEGDVSRLCRGDPEDLRGEIAGMLGKVFVADAAVANALAGIIATTWRFGGDYDEIVEEELDALRDIHWRGDSGTDRLDVTDFPAGGGILIESTISPGIDASVGADGAVDVDDDIEWADVRGERFVLLLRPGFRTAIMNAMPDPE